MPKSQETWNKKEKEKKRQKKKEEKAQRKEERKAHATDGSLDSMLAYVDEYGRLPMSQKRGESTQNKSKLAFRNDRLPMR